MTGRHLPGLVSSAHSTAGGAARVAPRIRFRPARGHPKDGLSPRRHRRARGSRMSRERARRVAHPHYSFPSSSLGTHFREAPASPAAERSVAWPLHARSCSGAPAPRAELLSRPSRPGWLSSRAPRLRRRAPRGSLPMGNHQPRRQQAMGNVAAWGILGIHDPRTENTRLKGIGGIRPAGRRPWRRCIR